MINLNDVTVVTIDGVGKNSDALKALKYTCKKINFGDVLYFSPKNWSKDKFYKFIEIPNLSYDEYNRFCLVDLVKYVNTNYVLIIQDDGFVHNPELWNNDYLKYDYIGAPWPKQHLFFNTKRWPMIHRNLCESNVEYHVGNGGFTLRSKKLLEEVAKMYLQEHKDIPEDVLICIGFRKKLEELNLKFAPYKVAKTFSCESIYIENDVNDPKNTFGFHGRDTHRLLVQELNNVELEL
jgi:hypothetical protein